MRFPLLALCGIVLNRTSFVMAYETAGQPPVSDATAAITEISLERTWCFGSCPIDKLVLHSNGTAEYTGWMNVGRVGYYTGQVPTRDVERLGQWIESQGFFAFKDSYGSANVDVNDYVVSVTRGTQRKTVVSHQWEEALQMWGIETTIEGISSRVLWHPLPSGIRGSLWRAKKAATSSPSKSNIEPVTETVKGFVTVISKTGKEGFEEWVLSDGKFAIPLPPGTYTVRSYSGTLARKVVVHPAHWTQVDF